jgi:hypothetical protein
MNFLCKLFFRSLFLYYFHDKYFYVSILKKHKWKDFVHVMHRKNIFWFNLSLTKKKKNTQIYVFT